MKTAGRSSEFSRSDLTGPRRPQNRPGGESGFYRRHTRTCTGTSQTQTIILHNDLVPQSPPALSMNTLIVSDLHLGACNSRADLVAGLLDSDFDRLVLNGDTVDSPDPRRFRPRGP